MTGQSQIDDIDDCIYVVSCIDDNYAQHLAVTYVSLLENLKGRRVKFFVVADNLSLANKEKLVASVEKYDVEVDFLSGDYSQFDKQQMVGHISRASYLRLLLAQLLPGHVHKVLYLDSDVVIEGDIATLWNVDISEYGLAAVIDHELADRLEILTGDANGGYFNSGVLLMNLDRWRDDGVSSAVSDCLRSHASQLLYADQDVLNIVFRDRWLPLDFKWNYLYGMNSEPGGAEGNSSPEIIHFAGPYKPWRALRYHPMRERYYHYLELTEWRGYCPQLKLEDFRDFIKIQSKKLFPSGYAFAKKILVNERFWGSPVSRWLCRILDIRRL